MSSLTFYILLALVAGFCLPTQAGINVQLMHLTRSSVLAAMISFAVGTASLAGYAVATRIPLPATAPLAGAPLWVWSGGCIGAFYVFSTIVLAPKIGALSMISLIMAGQLVASLILDHFGWLGYPVHPINLWRIVGVLLLVGGVALIKAF